jgi:hypothetical protein
MDNQGTLILFGLLVIAFGTVLTFSIVIVNQNRRLKQLETPRYGFMGKPLALIALAGFAAATGYLYLNPEAGNIINVGDNDVSVSDDFEDLLIDIRSSQVNTQGNLYQFQMVPLIGGVEWGASEKNKFDVVWEVVNSTTGIKRLYQNGLNINFQSKISYKLDPGNNIIKAIVTFNGKEYTRQVEIFIN